MRDGPAVFRLATALNPIVETPVNNLAKYIGGALKETAARRDIDEEVLIRTFTDALEQLTQ